jgi:hypothetical protein
MDTGVIQRVGHVAVIAMAMFRTFATLSFVVDSQETRSVKENFRREQAVLDELIAVDEGPALRERRQT